MIAQKTVRIKYSSRNRKYYTNLGYQHKEYGDLVDIKIEDLSKSNGSRIKIKCDYCDSIYSVRYTDYLRTKNEYVTKDACINCASKKREEILEYKIQNKELKRENKGYWKVTKNVLDELSSFINKYHSIGYSQHDKNYNEWSMIIFGLKNINMSISNAVSVLEYKIEDLQQRKPNNYYVSFQMLATDIQEFADRHKRFPSQTELGNELGIWQNHYQKFGTLDEIKYKMGYLGNMDLVDNRQYINKSRYELIVANYLIAQNIPYLRDQYPFKKYDDTLNYKSDFLFYLDNGTEIHCEVWGGSRLYDNQRGFFDYDKIMKVKLELYKKYNIKLISIYPNIFYSSHYEIQKKLQQIFQPYFHLPIGKVDNKSLISTYTLKELSDTELFNKLIQYSDNKSYLPTSSYLRSIGKEYLYKEVLKRFDTYSDFANKFSKSTHRKKNNYWNKNKIFNVFDYMIEKYGKILSRTDIESLNQPDLNLKNIIDSIGIHGGIVNLKLEYYQSKINNKTLQSISKPEIKYLSNIWLNKGVGIKNLVTDEQRKIAKEILDFKNNA